MNLLNSKDFAFHEKLLHLLGLIVFFPLELYCKELNLRCRLLAKLLVFYFQIHMSISLFICIGTLVSPFYDCELMEITALLLVIRFRFFVFQESISFQNKILFILGLLDPGREEFKVKIAFYF